MITLEQIKNDYVRENYLVSHDLDTWFEFQNYFASRHPDWFEQHYDNIIKLVQIECLKVASENAEADHHPIKIEWVPIVIKGSITNENNIIK